MLFLCRLPENHSPLKGEPDEVLLRVYLNTEADVVADSVLFGILSELHMGPKLLGTFTGGRLEEYIPAGICDALERWLIQLKRSPSGSTSFDLPPENHEWAPATINCEALQKEIDNFRKLDMNGCVVTFCHNDLLAGNILLPEAHSGNIRSCSASTASNQKDIVFIEFEYASYNYRGFDFANHFIERAINYGKKTTPFYEILPKNFPTEGQMLEFMYNYEKEGCPNASEEHLQESARTMVEETAPFVPVSHLLWGIWGLFKGASPSIEEFDYTSFAKYRLVEYYKTKDALKKIEGTDDN